MGLKIVLPKSVSNGSLYLNIYMNGLNLSIFIAYLDLRMINELVKELGNFRKQHTHACEKYAFFETAYNEIY